MTEERERIKKLLADGKVSAEEAERLRAALEKAEGDERRAQPTAAGRVRPRLSRLALAGALGVPAAGVVWLVVFGFATIFADSARAVEGATLVSLAGAVVLFAEEGSTVLPYLFVILSGLVSLQLLPTLTERATRAPVAVAKDYWALLGDPLVRKLALYRAFLAMVTPALVVFLPVFVAALDPEEPIISGMDLVMGLKRLSAGKFAIFGLSGVSAGAFQHGLGRLFDRRGRSSRVTAAIIGALLASSALFLMPHLRGFRELAAVSFLMGFSASALFLPGFLLIIKAGRGKGMGTIVGLMELAGALGAAAGSASAAVAASLNPAYLLPITGAFPFLAAAFYVSAVRFARKEH